MALSQDAEDRLKSALSDRYRIQREVGRGGMATVYLAEDLKHRRSVAVKVLNPELAAALGAKRFLQEIETVGNLTHPHIVPLFDSGESGGFVFFVMPFIGGETLRERLIREGQLPVGDAITIARQVASGLAHAHGLGIVHRDVKPENVLLFEGEALLLDFGIALAASRVAASSRFTETGLSLGTPHYMSPEQAGGEEHVDHRADIYALGCLLHEMLTGQPPFSGATASQVLARQLSSPPPSVFPIRPSVGKGMDGLLARALEKTPADRFQSAREFSIALEGTQIGTGEAMSPAGAGIRKAAGRYPWALWLLAAAGLVSIVLATFAFLNTASAPDGDLPLPNSRRITFEGTVEEVTLSRDGRFVAFRTNSDENRLFVQELAGGDPIEIFSTPEFACCLAFSPDGSRLAFNHGGRAAGSTVILPRLGGRSPRPVEADVVTAWSPDGERLAGWWPQASHIRITDVRSGELVDSVAIGVTHDWVLGVDWSPDGRHLAVAVAEGEDNHLLTVSAETGRATVILSDGGGIQGPRWPPGEDAIYFSRGWDLLKLKLDGPGQARGSPTRVSNGHGWYTYNNALPRIWLSDDLRTMAFVGYQGYSNIVHTTVDSSTHLAAEERWLTTGTKVRWYPRVSPDGEWLLYVEAGATPSNLFIVPLGGGSPRQLTFSENGVTAPAWSPDGKLIAFSAPAPGNEISVVTFEGDDLREYPTAAYGGAGTISWGPHRDVIYQQIGDQGFHSLDSETGDDRVLYESENWIYNQIPSPDGSILAFRGSGAPEDAGLWVGPLPEGPFVRINDSISGPIGWEPGGEAVMAIPVGNLDDTATQIFRVPVNGAPPTLWYQFPGTGATIRNVSLTPDGRGIVAAVFSSRFDVVVVENPDPTIHRR